MSAATKANAVAAAVFLLFAVIVYGNAFSNGLCCADDGTNAVVAKSFAFGEGYANPMPLDGSRGRIPFDASITTGPALNVPAALVIAVFGNTLWAPGVTTATICLSLMLGTFLLLRQPFGDTRSAGYATLVTLSFYAVTAGLHFEHWYALLGEAPAAMFCLVAAAVAARSSGRRYILSLAGLLYGLAAITKLLAALSILPFGVWLAARIFAPDAPRRRRGVDALAGLAALLIPLAASHLWQVTTLGLQLYGEQTATFWRFVQANGAGSSLPTTLGALWPQLFATAASNSTTFAAHFGYSVVTVLVLGSLVAGVMGRWARNSDTRVYFSLLMGGAAIHLLWWVFLSNGRDRYALIGLLLFAAAVSCVASVKAHWVSAAAAACCVIALVGQYSQRRLLQPARFVAVNNFRATPRSVNLAKTAAFLSTLRDERPFVMGWWATGVDVEYAMPGTGNFIGSDHVSPELARRPLILVRNTTWVKWATTPEFTAWEQRCREVLLDAQPYLVSRCAASP